MTDLVIAGALLLVGAGAGGLLCSRWARRTLAQLATSLESSDLSTDLDWGPANDVGAAIARRESVLVTRLADAEAARSVLDAVLRGIPDPVLLVGQAGDVRFSNDAARSLLGGHVSEEGRLLHHSLLELVRSATSDPYSVTLDRMDHRVFLATTSLQGSEVVLVLRDISDQRRLLEIRRDFVADASHELKTPVASIQAASETVMTALGDADLTSARRFAQQVTDASIRLSRIVADLLDLSRLEAAVTEADQVDLGRLLEEVVENSTGAPAPTLQKPAEAVVVAGSGADLELAFANLVSNAVRHTSDDGLVVIRLILEENFVEISVSDTGEGIPSKHLPRIFERFYRVDAARSRDTGGTGLGLSIVRHIVNQHGGSIDVESILGEGATFTVRLPLNP